ncbi:hypothetical protein GQ55_2G188900 [Panicum hallii var. hallii]|uniref:Uncharacterized protein n=1 Tax=Panicum hallii var. hallii TaxID=1504633 RepID=A0A2T7EQC4_9POAL|nr:hypothetical protein GQ55_2G188900 [Panicum hallii var. hallii]
MAAPSNVSWDYAGHLHTNALHWEGFSHLLWESLSLFLYTEPPVIAIIWLGHKMGRERHGLKEIIIMVCESASVQMGQGPGWPCI